VLTWDASGDLAHLAWLSQKGGDNITLTRAQYNGDSSSASGNHSYQLSFIDDGIPLSTTLGATIQINAQGDEFLLAGWQAGEKLTATPSVWHAAITNNAISILSVQSEAYLGEPTDQLIFNSSDDLQTSYLSWNDNTQMQIQVYQMDKQSLVNGFDLRSALSLSQPIYELAISGDGTSLSWAGNLVFTLEQRPNNMRNTLAMVD